MARMRLGWLLPIALLAVPFLASAQSGFAPRGSAPRLHQPKSPQIAKEAKAT